MRWLLILLVFLSGCGVSSPCLEEGLTSESIVTGDFAFVVGWHGHETCPATVTVQAVATEVGRNTRPVARVVWGDFKQPLQVDLDIGGGLQFTLSSSRVDVFAADLSGGSVSVRSQVGFQDGFWTRPLTYTAYVDGVTSKATQLTARPRFARSLYGFERDIPEAEWRVTFRDAAGLVVYQRVVAAGTYWASPAPLAADVTTVDFTNNGDGGGYARALFGISLDEAEGLR